MNELRDRPRHLKDEIALSRNPPLPPCLLCVCVFWDCGLPSPVFSLQSAGLGRLFFTLTVNPEYFVCMLCSYISYAAAFERYKASQRIRSGQRLYENFMRTAQYTKIVFLSGYIYFEKHIIDGQDSKRVRHS